MTDSAKERRVRKSTWIGDIYWKHGGRKYMKMSDIDLSRLTCEYSLILQLQKYEEIFWENPGKVPTSEGVIRAGISLSDVEGASARMDRFSAYIAEMFPETSDRGGIIESDIVPLRNMQTHMDVKYNKEIHGDIFLKKDSHLPIAGSIKARGGIYEVLCHAEKIALDAGILSESDDYRVFASEKFRNLFSSYSISVASTGNLGLATGIISRTLGFEVNVHMSREASLWKKNLLIDHGVNVVEHSGDYNSAVSASRDISEKSYNSYFIDDENSRLLFLGYAVAGLRLKRQLARQGRLVDQEHPLFVYLPCGVGGAPGGVTFGLKLAFGDHVRCFWAEPTHSPSMLLGMYTGLHNRICVNDIGLDNKTVASGLAVGRPSGFVGRIMEGLLDGIYTVSDHVLQDLLRSLYETESIFLEPSALAGMIGPYKMLNIAVSGNSRYSPDESRAAPLHLVWATGGGMVPESVRSEYLCSI